MRVLLSTIGTRGEIQPVVALALELRAFGQEVTLCVPPDFREWIEGLGFRVVPIGPELRQTAKVNPQASQARPTPEQRRQLIDGTIATQFATVPVAAEGCDVIVGCGALQAAARSIAEHKGIPYVYASYCAVTLPSPQHAPIPMPGRAPAPDDADNRTRWELDAQAWNDIWADAVNAQRATLGLPSVDDVRGHIFTDHPLLAADPVLGPWIEPADLDVVQTGAWIARDGRPLSAELQTFLDAGEAPVYFGFGSIRAPEGIAKVMIESARALGRRAILSRGWADLSLVDNDPDCLAIGEVNQQALFKRVAAVVHHGGAGTTTATGRAGAPQVVVPQHYDQPYWAQQVDRLGIGAVDSSGVPTVDSLTVALDHGLQPEVAARAVTVAAEVRTDGARITAERLMALAR